MNIILLRPAFVEFLISCHVAFCDIAAERLSLTWHCAAPPKMGKSHSFWKCVLSWCRLRSKKKYQFCEWKTSKISFKMDKISFILKVCAFLMFLYARKKYLFCECNSWPVAHLNFSCNYYLKSVCTLLMWLLFEIYMHVNLLTNIC